MKWYSNQSITVKFILVTSLVVIGICASLYFFIDRIFLTFLESEMRDRASELAESLKDQIYNFIDPGQVQVSANRLLHERREISRITVYRRIGSYMEPFIKAESEELPDNLILYRTAVNTKSPYRSEFQNQDKEYWEFVYPVVNKDNVVGLTVITLNFTQYKFVMSLVRRRTILILLFGLTVMLVVMYIYTEVTIRRPLSRIVSAMDEVKKSNFDTRVRLQSMDEIGLLAEDFNRMTLSLGEAQEEVMRQNRILGKRVLEATAELQSRNLELFEAQDQLRRASRLATAGQVAAMLAHDLGSPLSSISGHLQLMLEDPARQQEEKERLNLILTQVERLSDTIRNFLKSVTGFEGHFAETNLNALLDHLIQLTGPVLMGRRIQPVLSLDNRVPMLKADSNQLQQLFLNLFTNAIDAMKDGGELRVSTSYEDSTKSAIVLIEDTGTGMEPEYLKNLFRPFFSTKEFGKGTGLGLAICKEIVKSHGGQIQVTSEVGKGSVFHISFPIETAHNQTYAEEIEPAHRG